MKIITAIIRPHMLDKVIDELEKIEDFPGMTVTDARGFGRRLSNLEANAARMDPLKAKTRVEIAAPDVQAQQILETLLRAAHTGHHGDGKVFVWALESAVRVQTGEQDEAAL